jgi:putative nucleotidyltransferase with HDIG domain
MMSQPAVPETMPHALRQSSITKDVREIIALVDNPNTSVAKLTSAIYKNQVLMERVLRHANSPLYGFSRRVSDPGFAVILLGFDALKEIVIRSVVTGAFRRMVNSMLRFEAFWNHSVGCGLGARLIAEETMVCDPTEAFVAGLLHDIGYIVLTESENEHSQDAILSLPGRSRPEAGDSPLEDYHASVGAWLIERWKVSPAIAEAIRYHHQPALAQKNKSITAVVHIAEVLCHRLHIGDCQYETAIAFDQVALDAVNLEADALNLGTPNGYATLFMEKISRAPTFESLVRDLKKNLIEVMEELPEQERLVLALLYHEGLSMPEVAKVLAVTVEDVERFQDMALARLRAAVSLMA